MKSFWNESLENKLQFPEINENIETSVCIIGAGLTGLSTGYYLSKHTDVVILEKDKFCGSTSGKNTGKVTSQHGVFYKYLIDSNGKDFAKKYLNANEKAIKNIEEIVNTENIECDFEKESAYVFSSQENGIEQLKEEKKAVDKIEKEKCKYVKNIELPIQKAEAIEFENQAKFNPTKYAYGLTNCIINNGGKILENSKATDINKVGDKYEISVNDYKITADKVVIATRYPTINIPGYYFLKMYQSTSYALIADVKENLFDGMYLSLDMPIVSFRTVNDNGKKLLLAVGYDYKTGVEQTVNGYTKLEDTVKKMYPRAEILYKWTAEDCISLDKIPYIGEYSNLMKNLYVATGFNKWGITSSNIAANIITDKILGKENEYEEIFKSTRLEPIKNKDEFKNMLKEAKDSIILSKFKLPKDTIDSVENGQGKIVQVDNQKVGVYKSETGEVFTVKPVCTHLGCELYFNNHDKIWECPCHGSKFSYEGKALEVPGIKDLELHQHGEN
ncbi:MAG: FAD-dependent oxidoreductase [Clostridia bacterium]|nr:FAD-dependent oxidoreductase [Clostridia bacterium]